ncbi:MAG: riboflavin synthase [Pseudohongiellaceae bacterium]|jgi:riboflavin synthase
MFTGIIETTGRIASLTQQSAEWRLVIDTGQLDLGDVHIGDSIAVSGCCLTVVELGGRSFSADVSNESMRCTNLGTLQTGDRVNLEKAMRADSRFGGHIVSGHVDGVGELVSSEPEGKSLKLTFAAPDELARYIAPKGSICIDGTSLTVNTVDANRFSINVIPHTQDETVIGAYGIGQRVNLEVDIIARYLERLMSGDTQTAGGISKDFLQQHGFTAK